MGKLLKRQIQQTRTWVDPLNPSEIPDLDYNYLYPITVYAAVHRTMDDDSTTLEEELAHIYELIDAKQDPLHGDSPGTLMTWTSVDGEIGSTEIVREINEDPTLRAYNKVASERAVGRALDLKADAVNVNKHLEDLNIHLTEDEKAAIGNAISRDEFDTHSNDTDIHVSAEEKALWNAKADGNAINEHLNNTDNPHSVTAHQVNAYTRSEIDLMFNTIRETFFTYVNIAYDAETGIATIEEYDEDNWSPNYILAYADELPSVTDDSLTYFALKPVTDYTSRESNECLIYVKLPGETWREAGLATMSNGDMLIRYPDTTMCVWVQGRFVMLFTGSGDGDASDLMWRPVVSEEGVLGWTRSSETAPPDPVIIKGMDGTTPVKGVDYFDGAPGLGLPAGGTIADLIVKTTDEDYDTEWMSFNDFLNRYFEGGGVIEGYISDWNNITNKPEIYNETGDSETDLMSQKCITDNFTARDRRIDNIFEILGGASGLDSLAQELHAHEEDYNNPHRITPEKISAVSLADFSNHTANNDNPHGVTASQVGLGNVNNTSDMDKPVSNIQELRFRSIEELVERLSSMINDGKLVTDVDWDNPTTTLIFTYRDGTSEDVQIPLIDIFNSMRWDSDNTRIVITLPDGTESYITIDNLITVYSGSIGRAIKIDVTDGCIKGTILPGSINGEDLIPSINLPGNPTSATPPTGDKSTKIATTEFVKNLIANDLLTEDSEMILSAKMGYKLNAEKASMEEVVRMINESPLMNIINSLDSEREDASLSANMGRELNVKKADMIHTSPSGSTHGRATNDLFGHVRLSDSTPMMNGEANPGTDNGYVSKADHVHPTDTSRASVESVELLASKVDEKVAELREAIDGASSSSDEAIGTLSTELNGRIDTEVETINGNINDAKSEINGRIDEEVVTLNETISGNKTEINNRVDEEVGALNEKINNVLDETNFSINEDGELIFTFEV